MQKEVGTGRAEEAALFICLRVFHLVLVLSLDRTDRTVTITEWKKGLNAT